MTPFLLVRDVMCSLLITVLMEGILCILRKEHIENLERDNRQCEETLECEKSSSLFTWEMMKYCVSYVGTSTGSSKKGQHTGQDVEE